MNDTVAAIVFYIVAVVILISAWGIIYCKNLVHSALAMTLCFITIAGLYALLDADFLAAVQIMIYAGTVVIIIALGIMMTRRISMDRTNMPERKYLIGTALVTGALFICLGAVFLKYPVVTVINKPLGNTIDKIAQLLLGRYVLSFEIAAVLLLAAMIGAVVLAKGADE